MRCFQRRVSDHAEGIPFHSRGRRSADAGCKNVEGVTYNELGEIELSNGEIRRCKVLEVDGSNALVQLFESAVGINLSTGKVRFLGRGMELPVSMDMLGRVFDGLGRPIDGGPELIAEARVAFSTSSGHPKTHSIDKVFIRDFVIFNWIIIF